MIILSWKEDKRFPLILLQAKAGGRYKDWGKKTITFPLILLQAKAGGVERLTLHVELRLCSFH